MLIKEASGWTMQQGIKQLLEPYFVSSNAQRQGENQDDYTPFEGISAQGAYELLRLMPQSILSQRQNYAPVTSDLLRAAINNPGKVDLFGYLIGPKRLDERVSIEGLVYYDDLDYRVLPFHDSGCQCDELWSHLEKKLGLESALDKPDEIRKVRPRWNPGKLAWRLWWD